MEPNHLTIEGVEQRISIREDQDLLSLGAQQAIQRIADPMAALLVLALFVSMLSRGGGVARGVFEGLGAVWMRMTAHPVTAQHLELVAQSGLRAADIDDVRRTYEARHET